MLSFLTTKVGKMVAVACLSVTLVATAIIVPVVVVFGGGGNDLRIRAGRYEFSGITVNGQDLSQLNLARLLDESFGDLLPTLLKNQDVLFNFIGGLVMSDLDSDIEVGGPEDLPLGAILVPLIQFLFSNEMHENDRFFNYVYVPFDGEVEEYEETPEGTWVRQYLTGENLFREVIRIMLIDAFYDKDFFNFVWAEIMAGVVDMRDDLNITLFGAEVASLHHRGVNRGNLGPNGYRIVQRILNIEREMWIYRPIALHIWMDTAEWASWEEEFNTARDERRAPVMTPAHGQLRLPLLNTGVPALDARVDDFRIYTIPRTNQDPNPSMFGTQIQAQRLIDWRESSEFRAWTNFAMQELAITPTAATFTGGAIGANMQGANDTFQQWLASGHSEVVQFRPTSAGGTNTIAQATILNEIINPALVALGLMEEGDTRPGNHNTWATNIANELQAQRLQGWRNSSEFAAWESFAMNAMAITPTAATFTGGAIGAGVQGANTLFQQWLATDPAATSDFRPVSAAGTVTIPQATILNSIINPALIALGLMEEGDTRPGNHVTWAANIIDEYLSEQLAEWSESQLKADWEEWVRAHTGNNPFGAYPTSGFLNNNARTPNVINPFNNWLATLSPEDRAQVQFRPRNNTEHFAAQTTPGGTGNANLAARQLNWRNMVLSRIDESGWVLIEDEISFTGGNWFDFVAWYADFAGDSDDHSPEAVWARYSASLDHLINGIFNGFTYTMAITTFAGGNWFDFVAWYANFAEFEGDWSPQAVWARYEENINSQIETLFNGFTYTMAAPNLFTTWAQYIEWAGYEIDELWALYGGNLVRYGALSITVNAGPLNLDWLVSLLGQSLPNGPIYNLLFNEMIPPMAEGFGMTNDQIQDIFVSIVEAGVGDNLSLASLLPVIVQSGLLEVFIEDFDASEDIFGMDIEQLIALAELLDGFLFEDAALGSTVDNILALFDLDVTVLLNDLMEEVIAPVVSMMHIDVRGDGFQINGVRSLLDEFINPEDVETYNLINTVYNSVLRFALGTVTHTLDAQGNVALYAAAFTWTPEPIIEHLLNAINPIVDIGDMLGLPMSIDTLLDMLGLGVSYADGVISVGLDTELVALLPLVLDLVGDIGFDLHSLLGLLDGFDLPITLDMQFARQ